MEKKSSRRFSGFLCCSARTPSSRHAKPTTAKGPSSKIPPIQNEGQNYRSSSSMVVVSNPAGSLPINSAPTVPSSSNPSPFSHNSVMERGSSPSSNAITDNEPLPSSSKVQSVCSFQANPSPTPDVLEESSSQLSEIAVAHNDEPQLVLPSASSSGVTRVTALSDLINKIHEDAQTVNLDAVIDKISKLLDAIKESKSQKSKESKNKPEIILSQESESQKSKESQKKPEKTTNKLLSITSAGLFKLKDLLLQGVNGIRSLNDVFPAQEAKSIARDVVQGLGQAHWVTSCFLLVLYILDRFETLSSNQEDCLSLLQQMYYLAVDLKKLTGCEHLVETGTALIVEGSLMCCTQMDRSKFRMFFTTTVNKTEISGFKDKLASFNVNMIRNMLTWICSGPLCNKVRPAINREESYEEDAVGIEESLKSVTELLRWESEERVVAVIVHGFGGIGKSRLADAVFARYFVKDCKYSFVRLDSSPEIKKPEIVELQKIILKDLMRRTESGRESEGVKEDEILDFNDSVVGRVRIGNLLQKEAAFIYIDNVVNPESLEELLVSSKLEDAKKLRLLITTRDRNVLTQLSKMTRKVHEMQPLSHAQGKSFLSKQIHNWRGDNNEQITDQEREGMLNEMVNISGGIPKILRMITQLMNTEENQKETFGTIKRNSEELTGDTFRNIEKYIFAYNDLPDECKSPFLDICFFLKGWKWETVANIVGESQLEMLQKRAVVSKDEDMNVRVHDIILKIGKEKARDGEVKARDTRFDFTEATDDEIQEFFEKDMEYLKLVKGLWFSDQACNIPVTKLNSMNDSLRIFGHKMVLKNGQCKKRFNKLLIYKGETPHFPFKWSCLKNLTFLSYQPQNLNLLKEIPSSNLKHIELDGSLCSDREILSSHIKELKTLQVLRLINFHNLENLPEEWGTDLRENLKELTLSNCKAMKQLPGSISQLTGLQILELDNCCNLEQWPEGCESLSSSLKKIILCNCPILKSLPSCFVEALDSDSRRLFEDKKGMLSNSPSV